MLIAIYPVRSIIVESLFIPYCLLLAVCILIMLKLLFYSNNTVNRTLPLSFSVLLTSTVYIFDKIIAVERSNIIYFYLLAAYILIILWHFLYANKRIRGFVNVFKKEIIDGIVKFIDKNLRYTPNGCEQRRRFKAHYINSKLFTTAPDFIFSEDIVEGEIGGIRIGFAEVNTNYSFKTNTALGGNDILFVADFNKNFSGRTFVIPDSFRERPGKNFEKGNPLYWELVKLEDPEFEKMFQVYGSDQIEARYILSTNFMRKIVELRKNSIVPYLFLFAIQRFLFSYIKGNSFSNRVFSIH